MAASIKCAEHADSGGNGQKWRRAESSALFTVLSRRGIMTRLTPAA